MKNRKMRKNKPKKREKYEKSDKQTKNKMKKIMYWKSCHFPNKIFPKNFCIFCLKKFENNEIVIIYFLKKYDQNVAFFRTFSR